MRAEPLSDPYGSLVNCDPLHPNNNVVKSVQFLAQTDHFAL